MSPKISPSPTLPSATPQIAAQLSPKPNGAIQGGSNGNNPGTGKPGMAPSTNLKPGGGSTFPGTGKPGMGPSSAPVDRGGFDNRRPNIPFNQPPLQKQMPFTPGQGGGSSKMPYNESNPSNGVNL